jgi:hypothetical protein
LPRRALAKGLSQRGLENEIHHERGRPEEAMPHQVPSSGSMRLIAQTISFQNKILKRHSKPP